MSPPHLLGNLMWHSPGSIPLALLILLIVVGMVLWIYPPQLRAVPRPWSWGLPALRVVAFLALVLALLKPVLSRPRDAGEQGAILILVDRSRSMNVCDTINPAAVAEADRWTVTRQQAARLVALADGMGKVPAGARSELFTELAGDAERCRALLEEVKRAQSEVDYAKLSGRDQTGPRRRVADATDHYLAAAKALAGRRATLPTNSELDNLLRSISSATGADADAINLDNLATDSRRLQADADMRLYNGDPAVRAACDALAQMSRFQLVETALTAPDAGLLARLPVKAQVYGYGVAGDLVPVPLRGGDQNVRRLLIDPNGDRTDLTGAIRKALDQMQGAPVQAVILFSDGRQVGAEANVTSDLSASGVPTFALASAAELHGVDGRILPPPDLSLTHITAPQSLFVGETLNVRADVRCAGLQAWRKNTASVGVELHVGDQVLHKTITIPPTPDEVSVPVEFSVKLEQPGAQQITLRVPPAPNEISTDNNVATRWVKVLADKTRIVMLAGSPGWDFRYVRNALSRKPWADLQDFVLDPRSDKLPLTPDQILRQDLLILYDVAPKSLDAAQWEAVRQLVEDRGGSVILMAGDQFLPAQYIDSPIASLLPFQNSSMPTWRTWQGEKPFYHIVPAPGLMSLDMLRLADDADQSQERWTQLPAIYRYLELPELKPNVRPLLVERDTNAPLLTEGRVGRGRVFFIGVDETWRWRYKVGERDQDRFWLQFIRYAAEEPYALTNGNLALDADRIVTTPDSPIHIRARTRGNDSPPTTQQTCDVKVMQAGHNLRMIPLASIGGAGSGRFEGSIDGLPAGDYTLELTGEKPDGSSLTLQYPLHVAVDEEAELVDLSGDRELLRHIADSSGGEMLPLEQFDRIPARLSAAQERLSRLTDQSLWDSPYLFAFVLACLSGEWAMRKRFGLA